MTAGIVSRSASRRGRPRPARGGAGQGDRLAELHEQIVAGTAALVSSQGWEEMLQIVARMPQYSLRNVLLIARQAPEASRVAGFRVWQGLGRQVRKGEKGIAILAPCTYRPLVSEQDAAAPSEDAAAGGQSPRRQIRGFRAVYVFDISQTEGEPLPEVGPVLLDGQAPPGLWDGLAAQITAHGYTVERGECSGANGYTDPATKIVRIRADVSDAQAVKTLAHELGHIECGHVQDLPTYRTCRGRCEVEAESVAYVLAAAHGLDAGSYTFGYVAGWSSGDVNKVRESGEQVVAAARRVLAALGETSSDDAAVA